jgi:2-polyprenyl-3-methyl-5-hydroxy-6-metoxy-1,4-benzoquinol methylase
MTIYEPGRMNAETYYAHQARARGLTSSEDVELLVREMTPVYQRLLTPWLPRDPAAAIYEAGCGPGVMLRYLRQAGYRNVTGSDSSQCQIDLARDAGLPVRLADSLAELKEGRESSWDRVIAIDFIEHLSRDDFIEFLRQTHRALKPGGALILRGPNGDSPFVGRNYFNDITHVWACTTVALRALLGLAGYQRVEFADETIASIRRHRWLKVPLARLSRGLLRGLIRAATREDIPFLAPSLFVAAWK